MSKRNFIQSKIIENKLGIIGYLLLFLAAFVISLTFDLSAGIAIMCSEIFITVGIILIFFYRTDDNDRK